MPRFFTLFWLAVGLSSVAVAQDKTAFAKQDIIYGYKDGLALTMALLKPQKPNGKAVISMVSGNWVSSYAKEDGFAELASPLLASGYTVFLTLHGSAPRYTIADALKDVQRAVQYVRFNAGLYGVDAASIGITGASSGGHLALLAATADDAKNPSSKDPVEQASSKVQAAAVFFPPTDFLNWGVKGFSPAGRKPLLQQLGVLGAFEFKEWDSVKRVYTVVQDEERYMNIAKSLSPAQLVTSDDAPTYMVHGDKDLIVPLQQSREMQEKLQAANIPVALTVKPGAGHGWKGMTDDEAEFVKWFDRYLRPNATGSH